MINSGIYKIEHTASGKMYIGSSQDIYYRLRKHREKLRNKKHANPKLQAAWNKHGESAFIFTPILICAKKDLVFYEQRAVDGYQAAVDGKGYNIREQVESNKCLPSKYLLHKAGNKYHRLRLLESKGLSPSGSALWLCRCDCGKEKTVNVAAAKRGLIKSCGCVKTEMLRLRREHKAGEKYGRLTLVSFIGKNEKEKNVWLCRCDCEREVPLPVHRVQLGLVKSCGCLRKEIFEQTKRKYRHKK